MYASRIPKDCFQFLKPLYTERNNSLQRVDTFNLHPIKCRVCTGRGPIRAACLGSRRHPFGETPAPFSFPWRPLNFARTRCAFWRTRYCRAGRGGRFGLCRSGIGRGGAGRRCLTTAGGRNGWRGDSCCGINRFAHKNDLSFTDG